MNEPVPIIAIDGPSASGKGTVAQIVAQKLGFHFLDSGSLYRLVALTAINAGCALDDEITIAEKAKSLDVKFEQGKILLTGEDVTETIRQERIGTSASKISALPKVRDALTQRQRDFAKAPGLVADGRDMGSVIFPTAQTKIFLTASAEVRAERRYKQLITKGNSANLDDILKDIRDRDVRDSSRAVAPLKQQADALLLDTSDMTIETAVQFVLDAYLGK
ncbi:(d)CMP kinase [Leeia sp. TBRC 13508]|uniref:Cytidylate kinase n=1 Tax=Leeia speluncae TaxID=2884804 RepID=A0ABS8D2M8_9NEIS|nr:(d)CMP kinase [Leeia speluncae]MCB6182440.1 (d)CMP kinase [Leeia speluncae]